MEKSHWLFVEGTQCDANFLVGLQKYATPAPVYSQAAYRMYRIGHITGLCFTNLIFVCWFKIPPV